MLLYDAACRLCRFTARLVVRIDRAHELAVLPLQDDEAAALLASLSPEQRLASWWIALPNGSLLGQGAGLPALFEAMRITRPLGVVARALPGRLLDRTYELVARNRRTIGRLVPDGPPPRRYP